MAALEVSFDDHPIIPLDERADRIIGLLEQTAFEIGHELIEAKAEHPGEFVDWVQTTLPFGIDKAERLMAITRAFASSDPLIHEALPPAWSALYELRRLPPERLERCIEVGVIHPEMTVAAARTLAAGPLELPPGITEASPSIVTDVIARDLLRQPRTQLSTELADALSSWLGS